MKAIRIVILIVILVTTSSIASGMSNISDLPIRTTSTAQQPGAEWPTLTFVDVVGELDYPVHLANAGDGSGRLFIVEQGGIIRIFLDGLLTEPFLDISNRVRSPLSGGGGEEGLLSIAFPPGYGSDQQHFYVYYTNQKGDNQVSRFRLTSDPNIADPDSEELIIYLEHPDYSNHNGGQLAFGPDGYLYIGTGDGGGGGDPKGNAQSLASLLGKILRIDVESNTLPPFTPSQRIYLPQISRAEGTQSQFPQLAYRIPPDNPFVGMQGYREEIWALGLRNPWRFSFDRSMGDLYIADVGQKLWEEVDFQPASSPGGENYGWDYWEANECYEGPCNNPSILVFPVFAYSHDGGHCSVTGGFTYRGQLNPGMQGIYFFADFCSGNIWGLQKSDQIWESHSFTENAGSEISSFGEDETGEIYLVQRADETGELGTGAIYRINVAARE